ncbi:hypothetical protein DPMN_146404 [Dreissena polymorpha]|uniref:Apple domain-containing protein n=1 Tax=Dreissena polymorpha TaxID=45954 RepID=A0A9D4J222_DREPO|nr:hypothetical protein DPMN_146404 [Dreissena polymorpha]
MVEFSCDVRRKFIVLILVMCGTLDYTKANHVAIGKNARQTDGSNASLAVDGRTDTCSQTASVSAEWTLDLTEYYLIDGVKIYADNETKYKIEMGLALGQYEAVTIMNTNTYWYPASNGPYRHVRITANPQNQPLKLCELELWGDSKPRTPQFRVFTGIAMSNPPVRTVSSVCQIECSSICLGQTKPACVTAQFDQSRKSCALFDGFEHVESPTNANKTVVFAFAAHIFTK